MQYSKSLSKGVRNRKSRYHHPLISWGQDPISAKIQLILVRKWTLFSRTILESLKEDGTEVGFSPSLIHLKSGPPNTSCLLRDSFVGGFGGDNKNTRFFWIGIRFSKQPSQPRGRACGPGGTLFPHWKCPGGVVFGLPSASRARSSVS